jgi:O-antigen ligase
MIVAAPQTAPQFPQPRQMPPAARKPKKLFRLKKGPMPMARDAFHVTLLVLVTLNISRLHMQFSALKAMRPELLLTIVCLALAFAKPAFLSQRPIFATWPARGMALFGILACCSALFGISLGHSAVFILNVYVKTLIFGFLIVVSVRSARDLYALVWAGVLSAGWLAYTSMFVFKMVVYGNYARLANLDTYDANDVGLVMLVGLGLTLLAFQTSRLLGKVACAFILLCIGATIAKSGSRGAFVGLLALGAALVFLADRISLTKRLGFVAVTALGMILFAPPGYWQQMKTIEDPKADYNWNTVNGRRQVALRGIGYMLQYPVFGVGINNFSMAECSISEKAKNHVEGEGIRCTPPHNAYVEAAAETGIPGGLMWILLVPGSVVWLTVMRRKLPQEWATGDAEQQFLYMSTLYLAVLLAGYAAGSFFLSFTWYDVSYYVFALLAGLQVAITEKMRRSQVVARPNEVGTGHRRR